ncbi:MAG: hypothetical protein HZA17_13085 [Nitrospirae bacterium]|nr:hypothetical protein [Nitrospirota bacterium]
MAKVPVNSLIPGMKLSRSVKNESGMVLIAEGTELSEMLISRLNAMNIDGVCIESSSRPLKSKKELLSELEARFSRAGGGLYMDTLKKAFQDHIEGLQQ